MMIPFTLHDSRLTPEVPYLATWLVRLVLHVMYQYLQKYLVVTNPTYMYCAQTVEARATPY